MNITEMSVEGFKGATFNNEKYGPETLIIGPNFRGKTMRLQAIQLAFLGYIPGMPRTNPGIFRMASGPQMVAEVAGAMWHAKTTLKKSGRSIEKFHELTFDTQAESITAMLDAEKFLAASGPGQLDMIWQLAKIETKETRASILGKMKAPPAELTAPAKEDAHDMTLQEWIAHALEKAKELLSTAKATADRMAKTQQGMVALEKDDAPVLDAEALEQEIAGLETELEPIKLRRAEIAREGKTYRDRKLKYDQELTLFQSGQKVRNEKLALIAGKALALKKVKDIEQEMKDDLPIDTTSIELSIDVLDDQIAAGDERLRAGREKIDELIQQKKELAEITCCPHCKSDSKSWKKNLLASIKSALSLEENAFALEEKGVARLKQNRLDQNSQLADRKAKRDAISERIQRHEDAQSELNNIVSAEGMLGYEPAPPTAPDSPEDTAEEEMHLQNDADELVSKIYEKKELLRSANQARARAATAAQATLQARENESAIAAAKDAVKVMESEREEMINVAFQALLGTAEPVYRGILKTPLEYIDGELGRRSQEGSSTLIPFAAFSGTEALVSTIALQVSLGAKSPAKIVLLDELGRLDPDNKNRLISNLHVMIKEKMIDQWIAIDVTKPKGNVPGITIIEA